MGEEETSTDLPFKPDWCTTVRRIVLRLMPDAYEEGVGVLQHLAVYEDTDDLGGSTLSAVLLRLSAFKQALGIDRLPDNIEGHGFVYLTF